MAKESRARVIVAPKPVVTLQKQQIYLLVNNFAGPPFDLVIEHQDGRRTSIPLSEVTIDELVELFAWAKAQREGGAPPSS